MGAPGGSTWNPFRPLLCPACLGIVDPQLVSVRRPETGVVGGVEVARRSLRDHARQRGLGDLANEFYLACDRGHELPDDFEHVPQIPIALIGSSKSMKSHFIGAAAYDIIDRGALVEFGPATTISAEATSHTERALDETYLRPGRYLKIIPRTTIDDPSSPVHSPLCLRLTAHSANRLGPGAVSSSYLMFFDAPGELTLNAKNQSKHTPYLATAAAIVVFVDPLQISKVRSVLAQTVTFESEYLEMEMSPSMVNSCARVLRRYLGRSAIHRLARPLIIAISKADLFDDAQGELAYFARYRDLEPGSAAEDQLAREFIDHYAPGVRTQATAAFRNVHYTFLAAAGANADAAGHFPQFEPWGCSELVERVIREVGWP